MASRKQNEICCSAYGCKRELKKYDKVPFHSFMLKNGELFK